MKAKGHDAKKLSLADKAALVEQFDLASEPWWQNAVRYALRQLVKATRKRPALVVRPGRGIAELTPAGRVRAAELDRLPTVHRLARHEADEPNEYAIAAELSHVMTQIRQRRGQRQFRDALRRRYNDTCVVTGCTLVDVLEAAHIEPYRQLADHDPGNGLLLRADIHTLFDLDLIGIDPATATVKLNPLLADTSYAEFQGKSLIVAGAGPDVARLQVRWAGFERGVSSWS